MLERRRKPADRVKEIGPSTKVIGKAITNRPFSQIVTCNSTESTGVRIK